MLALMIKLPSDTISSSREDKKFCYFGSWFLAWPSKWKNRENTVDLTLTIKIIIYAHWLPTTSRKGRSPTLTIPCNHQKLLWKLLKSYSKVTFLKFRNNSNFFRCALIFFLGIVDFFAPSMWWITASLEDMPTHSMIEGVLKRCWRP